MNHSSTHKKSSDAPEQSPPPVATSSRNRRIAVSMALVCLVVAVVVVVVLAVVFAKYYRQDRSTEDLAAVYVSESSEFVPLPNGATMHVRDEGNPNGPVLVMVHGGFGSLHNWEGWTSNATSHLPKDYRLVSMDLLGHGLTGAYPANVYTRHSLRDAIRALLLEMGILPGSNYSVAGNSFGGGIALEMALAFPDEIDALVLVDSEGIPNGPNGTYDASAFSTDGAVPPDDPSYTCLAWYEVLASRFISTDLIKGVLRRMVYDQDLLTDEFVDYFAEINRHEGNREAQLLMFRQGLYLVEQNGPTDLLPRLGELRMPVLVMNGANDTLVPVRVAHTFHEHIKHSELAIVEKAGHLPMIERPNETARIVHDFLERNLPAGCRSSLPP